MSEVSSATRTLLTMLQWRGFGAAKAREVAKISCATGNPDLIAICTRKFPRISPPSQIEEVKGREAVDRILEKCQALDIAVRSMCDVSYPEQLRMIEDAPPILFFKGDERALSRPCVAVVGTRQASEAGRRAANLIACHLVARSYCIVSGLALGIDAAAHWGALEAKGVTVAVLAHGLDTVAPTSNRPLAAQIVEHGGVLLSEHPPGVPPRPAEFVRRNRIQSGLSLCSIVVESGETGGAIHQANFTIQQGRYLLAVCPKKDPPNDFNYGGANHLIAHMGAIAISGTKDLDRALLQIVFEPSMPSVGTSSTVLVPIEPMDFSSGGCPL